VPYYLAPLWDAGVRHRAEEIAAAKTSTKTQRADQKGRVPQELRQKLKKARGAKSLLQDLEEEVRAFVQEWEAKNKGLREIELDSEDEESKHCPSAAITLKRDESLELQTKSIANSPRAVVFVGRNGGMSDEQRTLVEEELEREKLVWESAIGDQGASFGYIPYFRPSEPDIAC
jgi:hypothetical protein